MDSKRPHTSGIEWQAQTNRLVLVSAREQVVVEVSDTGEVTWAEPLVRRFHRQAEGIAFDPERNLLIGDEGGKGAARLTIYGRSNPEG